MYRLTTVLIASACALGCGEGGGLGALGQSSAARFASRMKVGLEALATKDYPAAIAAFESAADAAKKAGEPAQAAEALQNLAVVHFTVNQIEPARAAAEKALAGFDEAKSDDGFLRAAILLQVGRAQEFAGDLAASEKSLREALDAFAKAGDSLPQQCQVGFALGATLRLAGKHQEAISAYEQALDCERKQLKVGEESASMAAAYCEMGRAALDADDRASAGKYFDRANKILRNKRLVEKDASPTASLLESWVAANVARLLKLSGQPVKLDALLADAAKNYEQNAPQPSPELAHIRRHYAQLLAETGKFDRAELEFKSALRECQELYKPGHPELKATMLAYAALLDATKRADDAERVRQSAHAPPAKNPEGEAGKKVVASAAGK
jgi:tetratricopeptide (TPR) repeat protein